MRNVTLRQLQAFVAVARHRSFARAAGELALSTPAVSMQVGDLEQQVGLLLFDRSNRSVSLTQVGQQVLVHARRTLVAMRELEDMVANLRGLQGGSLDVAMFSTADYFVPHLLARFRGQHPHVQVRLHVANNRAQIEQLLQQREVELAFTGRPSGVWTNAEPFAPNPLVLVTATGHPFTRMQQVPAQALAREAFIMREPGSGTRAALEDYLAARGLTATSVMTMSSNESVKHAVMAGLGISLLPLYSIGLEIGHGLIAVPQVEDLPVLRQWYVTHKAGKVLSPAADAFRRFILQEGRRFFVREFGALPQAGLRDDAPPGPVSLRPAGRPRVAAATPAPPAPPAAARRRSARRG